MNALPPLRSKKPAAASGLVGERVTVMLVHTGCAEAATGMLTTNASRTAKRGKKRFIGSPP
jgi:hypothetical protein